MDPFSVLAPIDERDCWDMFDEMHGPEDENLWPDSGEVLEDDGECLTGSF